MSVTISAGAQLALTREGLEALKDQRAVLFSDIELLTQQTRTKQRQLTGVISSIAALTLYEMELENGQA